MKKVQKIVVVKIGTSIATTKRGKIHTFRMSHIAQQIKLLHEKGCGVILVVSAAVACGMGITCKQAVDTIEKQVLSGVGQAYAIATLFSIFEEQGLTVSQLLLTKQNFETKETREIIQTIIQTAFKNKIILVVNENDILQLNSFSGNDYLALQLSQLIKATHLFFLSDVEGIYGQNLEIIKVLSCSKNVSLAHIEKKHTVVGIGGIQSKIHAAFQAAQKGTKTFITHGEIRNVLTRILLNNEQIGTQVTGGVL